MFEHDYLINCYGYELDRIQRIMKDFYDFSDCLLYAFKIECTTDLLNVAVVLNSINTNLYC